MKFFTKEKSGFGLDIGENSIKLIEIFQNKKNTKIVGMSDVALPKGLIVNDAISDTKTFIYLLKQALLKPEFGKFSNIPLAVSLPESKSFVRVILIPLMTESEIETAIPVEAESFIPLPINQVYIDWQILNVKEDKMEVLIIATPKSFVDAYLNIFDSVNLQVSALEVESQSCHRALVPFENNITELLVDIDSLRTSLIMIEAGNLQFTSSIPIAGNSFTDAIAKTLGVSGQKAEMVKRKVGLTNTTEYPNLHLSSQALILSLSAEIKNIIKFHSEHSEKKLEKIILAGGGAKLKNLLESLISELGQNNFVVELGNPFINLKNLSSPPMLEFDALNYTTAIGLAIRGLIE